MNLNALTNLTTAAEKPNDVRDKATTDSGFEAAFKEASPVGESASRQEKNPESEPRNAPDSGDSNPETSHSGSERDAVQNGNSDSNGDAVTSQVTSTERMNETATASGSQHGSVPEADLTSTSRTTPKIAGTEQVDGAPHKKRVVAASIDPNEPAKQANEPGRPAQSSENAPLDPSSASVRSTMKTDDNAPVAQATASTAPAAGAQITSGTRGIDIAAQVKGANASAADPLATETAAETNAQGSVHGIGSKEKNAPPVNSSMPAVSNIEVSTADSTPRSASPPAMSLLERHLGGYSVRLLPQNGQTPESKTPGWSEGEASKTLTNVVASATMNANAPSAAQALSRLVMPEKTNAAQLQADLRARLDLSSTASQGDAPHEAFGDTRPNSLQTGVGVTQTMAAKPEIAAHVAQQIAQAMKASNSKSVEIALSPVELGRVRMVLSPSDAGITLSILADRPDTLDLMRRNIDDLTKSFSELGYDDISFSFGQNDQTADGDSQHFRDGEDQMTLQTDISDLPTTPTTSPAHLATAPDGIDMRL